MATSSPLPPQRLSSSSSATSAMAATIDPILEERLTSLLASPNFSVAQYLNLALEDADGVGNNNCGGSNDISPEASPGEREQRLEQRMASLALQLQMRTQSCHDEIGRIGAELSAIVPRCGADVGRLRVGLEGMELDVRGLLEGMEDDIGGVTIKGGMNIKGGRRGGDTGADVGAGLGESKNREADADPLATLHTLLNLRTHLTASRAILSAASSWDETINSIPMLLSTTPPNLVEAVAALSQLERGARALRGMPEGRDERDAALKRLRSQLEVLLKPQLLHALKRMDTRLGPLQQCVTMYGSLGKMEIMREEYVKLRPAEIHALWFGFGGGNNISGHSNSGKDGEAEEKGRDGFYEGGESKEDTDEPTEEEGEVEDFDFDEAGKEGEGSLSTPATTSSQTTARQFMEFLPTFYEAVLELLAKERTQSKLVFGPELSPSIVARVLIECFKPIVTSFERRLANVCPPPGKSGLSTRSSSHGGESGMGGTEAIAATYESTIQFLSLAYDQMEAWNETKEEAKKDSKKKESPANEGEPLLQTIRAAFLLIASPYLPYQRNLAEAERHPLGEAASMVAKDVRSVAVNFEDAAERLGDLAPFMFPLAEAAINRFELLNSGYNAPATLSSIDSLISNHAAELAIAMGTLSTNASSGSEFDEQHVNCALEILRIAGMFRRNLRSFEFSVRDRLRRLSGEMGEMLVLDGGVIPDELSPVQIRAMLAKEACDPNPAYIDDGTGVKCPTSVVGLRRLAGIGKDSKDAQQSPALFPKAHDSTSRLARSCLSFVFEVCYAIPERQLRGISALPVWKQEGGMEGDDETSYGILPQSFITHVGEHMLALVQALEPFASDAEALGLANEVMAGVMDVAVQPWKEFVAAAGSSFMDRDEMSQLEILMRGKDLSKYFMDDEADDDDDDEAEEDKEEQEEATASAAFCNQWLDVVGLAVTGRLLERTMRIPRLGSKGAEHLATDLNYIRNVFTALGVTGHPHPLLGYVAQLVTMEGEMLRSRILKRRGDTDVSEAAEVIKRAELRIAYVRSISV